MQRFSDLLKQATIGLVFTSGLVLALSMEQVVVDAVHGDNNQLTAKAAD